MDIDVRIGKEFLTINIENPYRFDIACVVKDIVDFGMKSGVNLKEIGIDVLIRKMVKGVAGCEDGCPADAKSLVKHGFKDFSFSYIEGGILSANCVLKNGVQFEIKVFPEFN